MPQIFQAILDRGLPSVNFFNGRLLSAEDMTKEQSANRAWRDRLGLAIGDGVAFGMEVSRGAGDTVATPSLAVEAGLGINRRGETISIAARIDAIGLIAAVTPGTSSGGFTRCGAPTLFNDLAPTEAGPYIAGAGVYLFVVEPACGGQGRAPVSGLDNLTSSCNTRYTIEGVRFRLISLGLAVDELSDRAHLRNRVAYQCFGTADLGAFRADLLGDQATRYGRLDGLRPDRLTDRQIPLAVFSWTADNGIEFIDLWSARRPLSTPSVAGRWAPILAGRRKGEAEAMFLQFEAQVADILDSKANLASIAAKDRFAFLPPAGVIPIGKVRGSEGFDYQQFFSGLTYRQPVFIEGSRVESLLRDAASYPPIDLGGTDMFWLYRVRENMEPNADGSPNPPLPYMIFANGHMPYRGIPGYNLAHYDYANYD